MFLGGTSGTKVQDALKRIFAKVRRQNFNCLEVTGIVANRFWGIPYVTVSAHSRTSSQLDDEPGSKRRGWARADSLRTRDQKTRNAFAVRVRGRT